MATAIDVRNVSKEFRVQRTRPLTLRESVHRWLSFKGSQTAIIQALKDVSFSIEQGQSFGIIGHNGAGKSTLLRLLCGIGRPTSGQISYTGQISGILDLGGGWHPDLTGRQNIMTVGALNNWTKAEFESRARDIIQFSELEEYIDQPVRTYSTGMYLRLAFASAMECDPAILVLDEVLAVGDERFQEKCVNRIAAMRKAGKTLVFTSHSTEEIEKLCDQVLVLEDGQVAMQAAPKDALSCYHDLMRRRTEKRAAHISATTTVTSIAHDSSRQGTQEASITAVNVYDAFGNPTDSIRSGEGLTLELQISRSPDVDDLACTIGIFTHTQTKCFEAAILSMKDTFGPLSSCETFRLQIKEVPLLEGRYYINVGLYPLSWEYMYDFHWQMYHLRVARALALPFQTTGIVSLDAIWTRKSEGSSQRRTLQA